MLKNKLKKIIFISLLSLTLTPKVYASCTEEEMEEFKKVSDDYYMTTEYNSNNDTYKVYFNINVESNYYYIMNFDDCQENPTANNYFCTNIKPGTYEIKIGKSDTECEFKTIKLELLRNNPYYNDPLCDGLEEFYLCQEKYDKEIDYETFKKRIELYKKNKESNQSSSNADKENPNGFIEYLKNNIQTIIIISVFTILLIITIIIVAKREKKRRRLE